MVRRDGWPRRRGLDLDHVGAEIAQKLATELALLIGELQNSKADQRAWQGLSLGHCSISFR
jgi:hypothetical protein